MPGPTPKRSAERRRRNQVDVDSAPNVPAVRLGPEPPEWLVADGLGLFWYESLRTSGQAVYYTSSDWASAAIIAKAIDAFDKRPSAHMLAAILSGFSSLAATEGDRRRLRIELERVTHHDDDEDASVVALDEWQRKLSG